MAKVDTPDDQQLSVIYADDELDDWNGKHQIGLSELATRLNAKQHFDNRGRQIWTDGAEEATLQWVLVENGGGTCSRSTTCAWRGAACARHNHPAAGAPQVYNNKRFYNPLTGKYGLEIAFSVDNTTFDNIKLILWFYTGTRLYFYVIEITSATGILQYRDAAGVYQPTPLQTYLYTDHHMWHKLKMVCDTDNIEYARIMLDGQELDMTGIAVANTPSALAAHMSASFYSAGSGTAIENIYFDDFILTHLEP